MKTILSYLLTPLFFSFFLLSTSATAQRGYPVLDEKEAQIYQIQLLTPPNQKVWKQLDAKGIELLQFHGKEQYTARFTQPTSPTDDSFYQLVEQQDWAITKHSSSFDLHLSPHRAGESAPIIPIAIWLNDQLTDETIKAFSQKYRLKEATYSGRLIRAKIQATNIRNLLNSTLVNWVDELNFEIQAQVSQTRSMHHIERLQSTAPGGYGLTGKGIIVGVGDAGALSPHVDFFGRILETTDRMTTLIHPEHVAGILGGGGLLDPRQKGMAPAVELIVEHNYKIIEKTPTFVEQYGMNITNNSYGPVFDCSDDRQLNGLSNSLDRQQRIYPHLIHVYASGNEGYQSCAPFPEGYHTILRFFPAAKNVLTVGSIDQENKIAFNSSRGPTLDGRLKPEVCARGVAVVSAANEEEYALSSGTSMAAPAVSGVLALLSEYYKNQNNGQLPAGALLKAVVCNTAEDLGPKGPDYTYGLGRVNALRALRSLEDGNHQTSSIYQGETQNFSIEVPANTRQLKVLLYWPDADTDLAGEKALANDLDLKLKHSQYGEVLPWILNPQPSAVHLPATRGLDRLNNIEQITIDQPLSGSYQLEVSGFDVPMGEQPFFLTYEFVEEGLELTYPTGGIALTSGEEVLVSWEGHTEEGSFSLSYSPDGGNNWVLIDPVIAAPANTYSWEVPEDLNGQGVIRVTHNESGSSVTNETPFVVIDPIQDFQLYPNCDQALEVSCMPHEQAARYELMILAEGEMKTLHSSTQVPFTFTPTLETGQNYWIALRIVTDQGIHSERTRATELSLPQSITSQLNAEMLTAVSCFGEQNGVAQAQVNGNLAGLTYQWTNGETGAIAQQLEAGLHQVSVTTSEGCQEVAAVFIEQPTELTAEVEVVHTSSQSAEGEIEVRLQGGLPPYQYTWSHDPALQSPSLDQLEAGTYSLTVRDDNGCELMRSIIVDFINSNITPKAGMEFKIFPNPAIDYIIAEAELPQEVAVLARLTNLEGKVIETYDFGKQQSIREVIDLKRLSAGTYLLHWHLADQQLTKKIVILRE